MFNRKCHWHKNVRPSIKESTVCILMFSSEKVGLTRQIAVTIRDTAAMATLSLFYVGTYFCFVRWQSMTSVVKCCIRKLYMIIRRNREETEPGLPSLEMNGSEPMKARHWTEPCRKT